MTHFLTRFHFGMGWVLIILAFCNTYYSTSMVRTRRAAHDDIQRELVKTHLSVENEDVSAERTNNFPERFWLIYEPVLSPAPSLRLSTRFSCRTALRSLNRSV